jgi:uncharacterized protein
MDSEVFLHGPAGRLHARLEIGSNKPNAPVSLLLHSHTSLGGSIEDPIIVALSKSLADAGYIALSINFRGAGRSQGTTGEVRDELEDAAAALDWLEKQNPSAQGICVGGFSFGSWIAMELSMRRPEVSHFITVSPPIKKYDFSAFVRFPLAGIIVQGDSDSVTDEKEVKNFFDPMLERSDAKVEYVSVTGGDHFLRGKIHELEKAVSNYAESTRRRLQALENKVKKAKYTRSKAGE